MSLFLYNLLFPLVFIFFIPGIIIKYIRRGGEKGNFAERFAKFAKDKREKLKGYRGGIWVHSVSVGETVIAVAMIKRWLEKNPDLKFVLSTTTTTGQGLAKSKAPEGVAIIFCPLDFIFFVKKVISLIQPKMLIIFETEIWPNMICEIRKSGGQVALVNARISDKSANGYRRFSCFFGPVLRQLSLLCVQTELDAERFKAIEPSLAPEISGNMKFDQELPAELPKIDFKNYFGSGAFKTILAASTHPGEEDLIAGVFKKLQATHEYLKLIIIPRHAERGGEIAGKLKTGGFKFRQKSEDLKVGKAEDCCDVLLADTTGEMLAFMNVSDIVIMGKSLAGHHEGHNIIEPALLGKPIISGSELRNFRYTLKALQDDNAIITVSAKEELEKELQGLIDDSSKCKAFGDRAKSAIEKHKGATEKTIELCSKLLK